MFASPSARRRVPTTLLAAALIALAGIGCGKQTAEESNRATAEKIQKKIAESMVDFETLAIEQKADPALVQEVQRNLTAINEYQGEINGKLDSVTINAIQSFQRTAGLKDDGIITTATREKLAAAAAKQPQA